MKTKQISKSRFNSDKEQKDIGITQLDFPIACYCDYQNEIQSTLWIKATVNLLALAYYVNQNVSCHLFVLDDAHSKDKDAILTCLDKLFEVATIQRDNL